MINKLLDCLKIFLTGLGLGLGFAAGERVLRLWIDR
jgi:hypothetical protein